MDDLATIIYNLVFLAILVAGACYVFARILNYRLSTRRIGSGPRGGGPEKVDISSMVDQALMAYDHAVGAYNDALAKGAKPEQLLELKKDIDKLKFVKDNEMLIRLGGPYLDTVAKSVLKMFK